MAFETSDAVRKSGGAQLGGAVSKEVGHCFSKEGGDVLKTATATKLPAAMSEFGQFGFSNFRRGQSGNNLKVAESVTPPPAAEPVPLAEPPPVRQGDGGNPAYNHPQPKGSAEGMSVGGQHSLGLDSPQKLPPGSPPADITPLVQPPAPLRVK